MDTIAALHKITHDKAAHIWKFSFFFKKKKKFVQRQSAHLGFHWQCQHNSLVIRNSSYFISHWWYQHILSVIGKIAAFCWSLAISPHFVSHWRYCRILLDTGDIAAFCYSLMISLHFVLFIGDINPFCWNIWTKLQFSMSSFFSFFLCDFVSFFTSCVIIF